MTNTRVTDALALRTMASAFDAQRGKLPVEGDPHRSPDGVSVARQISELGKLITDLGNDVFFRAAESNREAHTSRVIDGFAGAVLPAGEAASALGSVAHQLSLLDLTEHLRDQPDARDAREAAMQVMGESLETADRALHDAATSLHIAAQGVSPSSARLQAARRRSTIAASASPPAPTPAVSADPAARTARSRR
ncbi:hypothetical protein [Streptomyces catenulae]|uniref:Uncharacterized protein n=1 Tax=Streptomyces catenulae TaxID=66875 RepID=A0ABV2Z2E0_9ACTN|nr:hypothetical protein [Streptomyces catenulae]